jgi:hypothetical protein
MIKLPRIPDHLNAQWPYLPHQLRARDIEVARAVLEAAAEVVAAQPDTGSINQQWMRERCAVAIRALRIEGETT